MTECWLIRHGNSASDLEMLSRAVYRHRMLRILTLAIALLVLPAVNATAQDFDKGLAAAQRGDFATALREWTPLAEQGDADAQLNLGLMYKKGAGVTQNYKTALKWYRLAAEQGILEAQTNLGFMYNNGQGVTKDHTVAVKWFRLAAVQGDAVAQFNLGINYFQGRGVSQDRSIAVKWFKLAAEQGDADAQFNLGLMFGEGLGVAQDSIRALMWFTISASSGNETAAKGRDMVVKQATPAQIAKAQDLARECAARNYKGC